MPRLMRSFHLLVPLALTLVQCAPKPPQNGGDQLHNVANATGRESVLAVTGPTTPLIVDWAPENRADLEEAMHDGVAVVAFDNKALRLLRDCHIDGKYGYVGLTTKYQLVQLETTDEIRANLPLSAAAIIAKVGAELDSGKTLDVAMAMIGKKRTTWQEVTPADMRGACTGATHFVRGATVGAFVLQTGARGQTRAVAEVFGAGAGYSTGSSKSIRNADGSLDACKLASPEGETPPSQCAALIRLELEPIGNETRAAKGEASAEKHQVQSAAVPECPAGMVLAEGKCTNAQRAKTHLCAPNDLIDCKAQCEAGEVGSCNNFAIMVLKGAGVPADPSQADQLFAKACEGGNATACVNLAYRYYESNPSQAATLAERACAEGLAMGCEVVGELSHFGRGVPKDTRKAFRYYKAACDGGDHAGCTNTGLLLSGAATDIPKNDALGALYYKRACDGGEPTACGNLGLKYEFGVAVKKDPRQAVELFDRACRMSGGGDCLRIAIAHQAGFGVARDDSKARELYARACSQPESSFGAIGCAMLNLTYGERRSIPVQPLEHVQPVMQPQCEQDVPRACTFLGIAHLALGKQSSGEMYLNAGCKQNDYWACDVKHRLKLK